MEMFLAILLAVVATDSPIISNPGFEQLSEQSGLPEGWGFTSLPGEGHLVRYKTTVGEGQESRALTITVADDHPDKKVAYVAFQELPGAIAGESYRVSAKVRTQGLHTVPTIVLQCVDQSKSKPLAFARSPERVLNADIDQWERIETTIHVPDGTVAFRVLIGVPSEGNAGGTAMIDDIEVVSVP